MLLCSTLSIKTRITPLHYQMNPACDHSSLLPHRRAQWGGFGHSDVWQLLWAHFHQKELVWFRTKTTGATSGLHHSGEQHVFLQPKTLALQAKRRMVQPEMLFIVLLLFLFFHKSCRSSLRRSVTAVEMIGESQWNVVYLLRITESDHKEESCGSGPPLKMDEWAFYYPSWHVSVNERPGF